MNLLQRWKQTALHNKALVLTSVLVAFGTLFYAGAAVFQICMMKNIGKQTTKQTEQLITEANRIANSMEETSKQSKSALQASIEMARRDQRAWIGPITMEEPTLSDANGRPVYIKEGIATKFTVYIINSGKSPALNVKFTIDIYFLPSNIKFSPKNMKIRSLGVLQPQMRYLLNVISPTFTPSIIDSIKNNNGFLYIAGKITYEDVFRIPHLTTFCIYLVSSLNGFTPCDTYNDAN